MRVDALDRLRGGALVAMLLHHIVGWLTGEDARHVLPGWSGFSLTDVAAPAFFVAAGMSGALFVAGRRRRGVARGRIAVTVLRRYGLLVPLGMALRWALGWSAVGVGVLEALGICVVAALAVAALVPRRWWPFAAGATLVAGMAAEKAVLDHDDWLSFELIAGKFPLVTYVGFVLVGVALVGTGRFRDTGWVGRAAVVSSAAVLVLLVLDIEPDRYPGDLRFVVPGLAGTAIVYALAQRDWAARLAPLDDLVRDAAAHTLGIFIAHYAIFEVLGRLGVIGSIDRLVALPLAVAASVVLCLAAPRVPQFPWSPRTGWANWSHGHGRAGRWTGRRTGRRAGHRDLHGSGRGGADVGAPAGVGSGRERPGG